MIATSAPSAGEPLGDSGAEAARATGDKGDLAGELEGKRKERKCS